MKVLLILIFIIVLLLIVVVREDFDSLVWESDVDYKKDKIVSDNLVVQGEITLDTLNINGETISSTEDDLSFLENIPVKTDKKISIGNDVVADEDDLKALKYYWPVGAIVAYEGFLEDIEKIDGWAVCDGKNGTPDLTGRFIRGTDDYSKVGIVGGYDKSNIKPSQLPKHKHVYDLLVQAPVGIGVEKDENKKKKKKQKSKLNDWKNKFNELYGIPPENIIQQSSNTKNGLGTFLRPSFKNSDFEDETNTMITSCIDYTDPLMGKPAYFSPCKKQNRSLKCRTGYQKVENKQGSHRVNPRKQFAKHILSGANANPKSAKTKCAAGGSRIFCQNNNRVIAGFETNKPDIILQEEINSNKRVEPRNNLPKYYSLFYIIRIDESVKKQNFKKSRSATTKAPTTKPKFEQKDRRYQNFDSEEEEENVGE